MAIGRKKAARQRRADLHGYKYFKRFIGALERFHLIKAHHNRDLHYDQYIALILFCFFNPVLASLRAIQLSSILEKVQSVLGVKATSLGALSEASLVVSIETLKVKNRNIDTRGDFFTICRGPWKKILRNN